MASFTDNKTPTFNPYVQQQPVEAMVNVGMAKQQQYDQGLERIQESYNEIAGLDIMKDSDKSYIENKLSQTTAKLRGFAAGDFSNKQLTSSITGMVSGISKDENIKNAVYATQKVRSELLKANDAEKAGKSSIVNQWALNSQISAWMNDGKVGSSFSGEYTPYTDVDAKLREVYDKIEATEVQTENPFVRDVSGNTLYFSPDGKQSSTKHQDGWQTKIDQAMLSTIVKGKSSQKILDNFMTSLNADDIQQLGLNADYHYRNTNLQTLKEEFSKRISTKEQQYNSAISDIDLALATEKNLTPGQREQMRAARNNYSNAIENGDLDRELEEGLQALNNPVNEKRFKQSIYTDNYLNNMSRDLATQSIKQTYESNPYFQATMDLKNLKFKYDNANRDQLNKDRTYGLAISKFAWEREKVKIDKLLKKGEKEIFVTDAAKETKDSEYTIGHLQGEVDVLIGSEEEQRLNGGYGSAGELGALNALYASSFVDEKRTTEQLLFHMNGLAEKYMEDPSSINDADNANVREYLQARLTLDKKIARKQGLLLGATVDNEIVDSYNEQIEESLQAQEIVIGTDGQGYSGKDTLNFLAKASEMYTIKQTIRLDAKTRQTIMTLDTKSFEEYYRGTRQEEAAKAYGKYHRGEELTIDETRFLKEFRELSKSSYEIAGAINKMKLDYQQEYIRKRSPEAQIQIGVINPMNKEDIASAKALVNLKISQVNTGLGALDTYKEGDFNPEKAALYIKDNDAGYIIKKGYDGSVVLEIQSEGETQMLPFTDQELQTYFPDVAISNSLNEAKVTIASSPINSTNLKHVKGADGAISAFFSGEDIPGIAKLAISNRVRMDIEGSPRNNGSDADRFLIRLYYNHDNGSWSTRLMPAYTTLSGIQSHINTIDITDINAVKNQ